MGLMFNTHTCCHDWSIIYDGKIISHNEEVSFYPQYWLTTNTSQHYVGRKICANGFDTKVFNYNEFDWDCYHNFTDAEAAMLRFGRIGEIKLVLAHSGNVGNSITHNLCLETTSPHKYTHHYGSFITYLCIAIVFAIIYNHTRTASLSGFDGFFDSVNQVRTAGANIGSENI